MREIILESLTCEKTQDLDGIDECRLEVMVDGTLRDVLQSRLGKGQTWDLSNAYRFED
jgi:hypothetical protein